MKTIMTLAVLAVAAAGFLGFASPGHHVLNALGVATAAPLPQFAPMTDA
jgi:hypothetical protein